MDWFLYDRNFRHERAEAYSFGPVYYLLVTITIKNLRKLRGNILLQINS